MPETLASDPVAENGAAMPFPVAAIPATPTAAAPAASPGCCAPAIAAHCAVLASIERSVSWTLGAGEIGVAGFSAHA
ncbi:hypothetical protein [Burkholderia pseudomultivorans]|uniref:hypothetical protein n=1 Tax=Burkholderia pseudomultivorans TaxID=1207504 RepID=UPI002EDB69BF